MVALRVDMEIVGLRTEDTDKNTKCGMFGRRDFFSTIHPPTCLTPACRGNSD